MRRLIVLCLASCLVQAAYAADPSPRTSLDKFDGAKWAERVRAVVAPDSWTVTSKGNEITIQRKQPASFTKTFPNPPPDHIDQPGPAETVRLKLHFGPALSLEEYERLAKVNSESSVEYQRLVQALGLSHKFYQFIATTPEEEAKLKKFHEEVAKLPKHDLPDLYTLDHSIRLIRGWDSWSHVSDANVAEECREVEESIVRYFGVYDPAAARDPNNVARYSDRR
jgi:hypothetical protein